MAVTRASREVRVEMDGEAFLAFVYGVVTLFLLDRDTYFDAEGRAKSVRFVVNIRKHAIDNGVRIVDKDTGAVHVVGLKDTKDAYDEIRSVLGF